MTSLSYWTSKWTPSSLMQGTTFSAGLTFSAQPPKMLLLGSARPFCDSHVDAEVRSRVSRT